MLQLKTLVDEHLASLSATSLTESLGDGYLYLHNPLFRNVRDTFESLGGSFTTKDEFNYFAFPLNALERVLKSGRIVYFENFPPIQANAHALGNQPASKVLQGLRSNSVLHESCHLIADRILPHSFSGSVSSEQDYVLRAIMSESFANAAEAIGNRYLDSEVHRFVYNRNSFFICEKEMTENLRTAEKFLGLQSLFKLLFLAFLFSNFLFTEVTHKGMLLLLEILEPKRKYSTRQLAILTAVLKLPFRLLLAFRLQTGQFFFKQHGMNGNLSEIFDFNFLARIGKSSELMGKLDELARIIEKGPPPDMRNGKSA